MNNDERLLNAAISNFKKENGIKRDRLAFDYFTTSQILKDKGVDFEDIDTCFVDGGNDGGIDSFAIFINDKLIQSVEEIEEMKDLFDQKTSLDVYIIQNKEQNSFSESIYKNLIPTFKEVLDYNLELTYLKDNYNFSLIDKIIVMRKAIDEVMLVSNLFTLNIIYACKGDTSNVSEGIKHKQSILRKEILASIKIPSLNIDILGANELRSLYVNRVEDELVIKYDSQMSFESEEGEGEGKTAGYITTIRLKDYFDFVTKDSKVRESILESNIRHYQGNVTVNKGIVNTLDLDKDIEFWWLNNGITILATEIVPLANKKLRIKDPQVVNGLQTTFCIVEYLQDNYDIDDKRTVLVKIIKITDAKSIDKIISSTNSQTEVRAADLRATDDLQRHIEQYFLSKGYFYDRRKNYYKNLKKDRNKTFNIGKTAQYIETLLFKKPHAARSNPTTLLKRDESYKRIFNNDINIDAYLSSCKIFKVVDSFIKEFDKEDDPINKEFGASMKHYTFHIMLIATVLVTKKLDISGDDLENINIDLFTPEILKNSGRILFEAISNLGSKGEIENAISAAKVKPLTDEILEISRESISVSENGSL